MSALRTSSPSALAAVAVAALLAFAGAAPATAAAPSSARRAVAVVAAAGFNAGGTWQLHQSNGFAVTLDVTQDGSGRLYGTASAGGTVGTIEEGSVDGASIFFTIGWSNGSKGRYTGSLGPDRRLSGTTFDLNNPSSQATWFTDRTF
ncbi:hypothetical protein [Kitasatospora sp. GP82]|uniref:hypothetical protein n=1 Tax=Kitasatospora sp. GP82 TaxID=3035089 RepID=UPI0024747EC3|nr:hypothetical protein [Kitasatospora sp. GP82]MDH6128260.1 hypothetical protein [Kitasatospora sp. GP82]